ncbi:MAG TPA: AraC family transcriptional regulator [Gemmatimonadales bacterium]|jgi:AraC-like DNA-binding protein|nr:AraC family transcriptional regulator [Gemmatimonadales bacterium]
MAAVAALLDDHAAVVSLRRAFPRGGPRVVSCRNAAALEHHLERHLTDALVLSPGRMADPATGRLGERYPQLPVIAFGPFRPNDAPTLMAWLDRGATLAVADVDDAIVGELVTRTSLTAHRRRAMSDARRVLRLDEAIQQQAWELLVADVERPVRTSALARRLGVSREHLSRQFGAGAAPNLKRVIDLTRIAAASQLLQNPGYDPRAVVRLLNFSSAAHLNRTAMRIAGTTAAGLGRLGPRGVLAHFAKGKMRSRG